MANRRQFIQSGVALSALSSSVLAALPAGSSDAAPLRLERFVFDNRFVEAVEVARYAASLRVPLAETSGDLTDLWGNELQPAWRQAPAAFAGITTRQGLFVLETLAADHRMRVVYRGEHAVAHGGCIAHVLTGPADLVADATPGPDAALLWAPLLGRAMARCPQGRSAPPTLALTTSAGGVVDRDEPLFSWIIAPRTAAAPL